MGGLRGRASEAEGYSAEVNASMLVWSAVGAAAVAVPTLAPAAKGCLRTVSKESE